MNDKIGLEKMVETLENILKSGARLEDKVGRIWITVDKARALLADERAQKPVATGLVEAIKKDIAKSKLPGLNKAIVYTILSRHADDKQDVVDRKPIIEPTIEYLTAAGCYLSIHDERVSQDKKWGTQNHDDLKWLAILMEEVGEVAMTLLDNKAKGHPEYLRNKELIQIAAVVVAWMECLTRDGRGAKVWEQKSILTPRQPSTPPSIKGFDEVRKAHKDKESKP